MRNGDAYVAALRDGRAVYLDGARVPDVTAHPAFAAPIRRIAATYDTARGADVAGVTTSVDPATGRRARNMWLIPRSADDLAARRRVHRFWAEPTSGLRGARPTTSRGS
jgi:4-hydroxyphenylacetate 3-monooxygenase